MKLKQQTSVQFAVTMLNKIDDDESYIFSDEAAFHINSCINRYNCWIWRAQQPNKVFQYFRDSPKILKDIATGTAVTLPIAVLSIVKIEAAMNMITTIQKSKIVPFVINTAGNPPSDGALRNPITVAAPPVKESTDLCSSATGLGFD
ncbi:hypothetical protein FQA39_LY03964 [Lamprigera yunnana]|nr:hypothetical protein FQA39_LY03964 [Lamprigera yunnana]